MTITLMMSTTTTRRLSLKWDGDMGRGTWGHRDSGTLGHGESETRGRADVGTRGRGTRKFSVK